MLVCLRISVSVYMTDWCSIKINAPGPEASFLSQGLIDARCISLSKLIRVFYIYQYNIWLAITILYGNQDWLWNHQLKLSTPESRLVNNVSNELGQNMISRLLWELGIFTWNSCYYYLLQGWALLHFETDSFKCFGNHFTLFLSHLSTEQEHHRLNWKPSFLHRI